MRQTLSILDWPRPDLVALLNPNSGDAHWAEKRKAKAGVADTVAARARAQGIIPVRGFAVLIPTFIVPDKIARDDDNYATGVMKIARDSLVRLGILEADDLEHLRQCPVNIETVPHRREFRLAILSVQDVIVEAVAAVHVADVSGHATIAYLIEQVVSIVDPTLARRIKLAPAMLR